MRYFSPVKYSLKRELLTELSDQDVYRILDDPRVKALKGRKYKIDHSYDIPFTAGYSMDRSTIYYDRDCPEWIDTVDLLGNPTRVNFFDSTFYHEDTETRVIDALGLKYLPAHQIAQQAEEIRLRDVLRVDPIKYNVAISSIIAHCRHKIPSRLPQDLDWSPIHDQDEWPKISSMDMVAPNQNNEAKSHTLDVIGMCEMCEILHEGIGSHQVPRTFLHKDPRIADLPPGSLVKIFHAAKYNIITDQYETYKSYDAYEQCQEDREADWIIIPFRGRDNWILGINPRLPDLEWTISPNQVKWGS